MTDRDTALAKLSARGITTLEGLVDSIVQRRRVQSLDPKTADELFEQMMAPPDPSLRSMIAPPSPSVPVVLDGKRVDATEIARYSGQPIDYVVTKTEGGERTLLVFTDRTVLPTYLRERFQNSRRASNGAVANDAVANALRTAGLQPQTKSDQRLIPCPPCMEGVWIHEHINFTGDVKRFSEHTGHDDLTQYDDGREWLDGDWNDVISSISCVASHCVATEHTHWGGARLTLGPYEHVSNLHDIGWGDRISAIWNTGW